MLKKESPDCVLVVLLVVAVTNACRNSQLYLKYLYIN